MIHGTRDSQAPSAGATLLELVVVLAVATVATAAVGGAFHALARGAALRAARLSLSQALLAARRAAYLDQATAEARVVVDAREVVVARAGRPPESHPLPVPVAIAGAPARGAVRFFASGLADNATVALTAGDTGEQLEVVVNQRGRVR